MSASIKGMGLDDLEALMSELGQPKYRASQLYEWLHTQNAVSYDQMTNLPKSLRAELAEMFPLENITIKGRFPSKDGSVKYLLELPDGIQTEMVAIIDDSPDDDNSRITACISSQAGCAMGCEFCATGNQGLIRDLTSDEIVSQVALMKKDLDQRVDNVVVMGQGEPFMNYDNVLDALRRINKDKGLGIGARHITISTSGIADAIYDLADEPEQFRLAVSLHSADQHTRNSLMPRLSGQPLHTLKKALDYYTRTKNRRITLEYMLLDGINDSDEQLEKLIEFCEGLNIHVNILKYNKINGTDLKPASDAKINEWIDKLHKNRIVASLRNSKGHDVSGACGQLIVRSIQD